MFKKPKPGSRGNLGATDVPSWVRNHPAGRPVLGEAGREFATRLMDEQYGPDNYAKGPGTEYDKIRKYGGRHFAAR